MDLDDDEEDDDESYNDNSELFDGIFPIPEKDNWMNVISTIKDKDEYVLFKEFLYKFKNENNNYFMEVYNRMTSASQDFLKTSLKRERVVIDEESGITVARKILKIKRKTK